MLDVACCVCLGRFVDALRFVGVVCMMVEINVR